MSCQQCNLPIKYNQQVTQHYQQQAVILMKNLPSPCVCFLTECYNSKGLDCDKIMSVIKVTTSLFLDYPEDGGREFLQNADIYNTNLHDS